MSELYYPVLPGLAYGVTRAAVFSTVVQTSVGGYELRYGLQQTPRYRFTLTYEFLRSDAVAQELQTLLGFYLARQGRFDSFRFVDPTQSNTDVVLGTGDGTTTVFALTRPFGGYREPFAHYELGMAVSVDGHYVGVYEDVGPGRIRLDTAPAAGAVVRWTGVAYRRVRFDTDGLDLQQFASDLWDAKTVQLVEVR